jgi:hypothetical protein
MCVLQREMGAGASVEDDFVSKERAQMLTGQKFDGARFDAAANAEGLVPKGLWNTFVQVVNPHIIPIMHHALCDATT